MLAFAICKPESHDFALRKVCVQHQYVHSVEVMTMYICSMCLKKRCKVHLTRDAFGSPAAHTDPSHCMWCSRSLILGRMQELAYPDRLLLLAYSGCMMVYGYLQYEDHNHYDTRNRREKFFISLHSSETMLETSHRSAQRTV